MPSTAGKAVWAHYVSHARSTAETRGGASNQSCNELHPVQSRIIAALVLLCNPLLTVSTRRQDQSTTTFGERSIGSADLEINVDSTAWSWLPSGSLYAPFHRHRCYFSRHKIMPFSGRMAADRLSPACMPALVSLPLRSPLRRSSPSLRRADLHTAGSYQQYNSSCRCSRSSSLAHTAITSQRPLLAARQSRTQLRASASAATRTEAEPHLQLATAKLPPCVRPTLPCSSAERNIAHLVLGHVH